MEQWAKGITGIEMVPDLGATPARVNHLTGVIQVSEKHMRILTHDEKMFVLFHEWAHIKAHTDSEIEADDLAFKTFVKMGGKLDESITVLKKLLRDENPEHHWRILLEIKRAKQYKQDHPGY
jgi:hypothetical protein